MIKEYYQKSFITERKKGNLSSTIFSLNRVFQIFPQKKKFPKLFIILRRLHTTHTRKSFRSKKYFPVIFTRTKIKNQTIELQFDIFRD